MWDANKFQIVVRLRKRGESCPSAAMLAYANSESISNGDSSASDVTYSRSKRHQCVCARLLSIMRQKVIGGFFDLLMLASVLIG
mmetsp:Transcript_3915/g.5605  ORF Transcript_3915/g.5605 Transcript_3915/m.5605 type:complete len:84 (-) Transcript_3915:1566-1817(-)